ncbi:hypothetical protein ASD21_17985 [Caulobacter sp. Root1455]|uniref:hypothetical protein n=1 Tax=Caulobacter sp. Root1455 TaxID=1736465 RepID=UPI000700A42E|nr:hypothetical protein [Caulobacter sp. Root1455]KQZ05878.1 hypothetical protein ASD21_17985 [Caulobacter sp. Root1455]
MATTKRPCVICGDPKTVRSHLIPAAVGRAIRGEDKNFWIGSGERDGKILSQSGVFDYFLCDAHEAFINTYENDAIEFLRSFELTDEEKRLGWYRRSPADTEKLVRFACSIVWRYHQSTRIEAKTVDIGPWETVLRDITFGGDISQAPDTLCFAMHHPLIKNRSFAFPPTKGRYYERVIWTTFIFGTAFVTKLDRQPYAPDGIRKGLINGRPSLDGRVQKMSDGDVLRVRKILQRMS